MMDLQNVDQLVQVQRSAGRGAHHLERSPAFQRLGAEMLVALQQALDAVAADASARVVVLAAQGKAFCAGHNLKDMAANPQLAYYQQLFAQCSKMMVSIARCRCR
jgi:enoyl-CoA hydratase/carnithine racemase